ncbi:hypothetical protein V5H41_29665, partial [Salmonella enterica]
RCWCGYGLTEFASTVCAKEADGSDDVGAPLPGKQGIRCWCGYGLTEFASTVCAKEADGSDDVGAPLPG